MSRNRYVGDYRIVESMDANGRVRSEAEYIGAPYVYVEDGDTVARARSRAAAGCLLGWLGYAAALLPRSAAMKALYIALPFAFIALPLALMTGAALDAFRLKPPFEHRHADRLENRAPAASFFTMLLSAVCLLGEAVNAFGGRLIPGDGLFSLGAAAVLVGGLIGHRQWKWLKCSVNDAFQNIHKEEP